MYGDTRNRRPRAVSLEVAEALARERDRFHRELVQTRRRLAEVESYVASNPDSRAVSELQANLQAAEKTRQEASLYTAELEREVEKQAARITEVELELEMAETEFLELESQVSELQEELRRLTRGRSLDADRARIHETQRWLHHLGDVRDNAARAMRVNQDPDDPWYQGFLSILQQVDEVLLAEGVTFTGVEGEPFDPAKHEALAVVKGPVPGVISSVERKGFVLPDGKIGRTALVTVTKE